MKYFIEVKILSYFQSTIFYFIIIVLWISSLYYFLSDVQDDALACIYQLQHLLSETITIILPNVFNHTTISKSISSSFLFYKLKNLFNERYN
jgi:hypothetical protein